YAEGGRNDVAEPLVVVSLDPDNLLSRREAPYRVHEVPFALVQHHGSRPVEQVPQNNEPAEAPSHEKRRELARPVITRAQMHVRNNESSHPHLLPFILRLYMVRITLYAAGWILRQF